MLGAIIGRAFSACAAGWTENNNICYLVGTAMTGYNCRTYCQSISASMICVPNSATNTYVASLASGSGNSLWIGYKLGSTTGTWYWMDGCSSSFTQWKSNKPNGGTYVWTDQNGNWDDADDPVTAKCGCEYDASVAPTRAPTLKPTTPPPTAAPSTRTPSRNPTSPPSPTPTIKPSTSPSLAPSAFPTYGGVVDCRSSCALLSTAAGMSVAGGQKVASLLMPPNFKIQFESTCAGLATYPDVRNMLQIINSAGAELFSVGMPDSNNLRVSYNGQIVRAFGPTMSNPMWSAFTTITTGYGYGNVVTATSYTTMDSVSNFYDTTGETFSLYLSAGSGSTSCSGTIRNIIISSKFVD